MLDFSVLALFGPLWRKVASCSCYDTGCSIVSRAFTALLPRLLQYDPPVSRAMEYCIHYFASRCSPASPTKWWGGLSVLIASRDPWPPFHGNLCYFTGSVTTGPTLQRVSNIQRMPNNVQRKLYNIQQCPTMSNACPTMSNVQHST